jgi:hypothetical protein
VNNVTYKVNDDFKYDELLKHGFDKTTPKDINPWYQCWVNMYWVGIFGTSKERVNVNKNTHEVIVECEYEKWSEKLQSKIDELRLIGAIA